MAETMNILIQGLPSGYEIEHLARLFFPGAAVRAGAGRATRGPLVYARAGGRHLAAGLRVQGRCHVRRLPIAPVESRSEGGGGADARQKALARLLYGLLKEATGIRPPWGLLTGVRPVNLLRKRAAAGGEEAARAHLLGHCGVSPEKFDLALNIYRRQQPVLERFGPDTYSLYVSVPFCPSRCSYCSFVSRTIEREGDLVAPYLARLEEELAATAALAAECGLRLATVYVGGGTPTALDAPGLERLLTAIARHFPLAQAAEYTVEAGRPDCTDAEKLALLKAHGVGRISINPQTMRDGVLQSIGRRHTAAEALRCFEQARAAGHKCINMDLIAGLPGDDAAGFAESLGRVMALGPENVTVHTLTLKRASNLVIDRQGAGAGPAAMVEGAYPALAAGGYAPYYLYRQKSGVENLENTGWTLPGHLGLYNVLIMEDAHTILAAGAGAATKVVADGGKAIKRFYNHKLPLEYLNHFQQVMEKKRGVSAVYAGHLDTQAPG